MRLLRLLIQAFLLIWAWWWVREEALSEGWADGYNQHRLDTREPEPITCTRCGLGYGGGQAHGPGFCIDRRSSSGRPGLTVHHSWMRRVAALEAQRIRSERQE